MSSGSEQFLNRKEQETIISNKIGMLMNFYSLQNFSVEVADEREMMTMKPTGTLQPKFLYAMSTMSVERSAASNKVSCSVFTTELHD